MAKWTYAELEKLRQMVDDGLDCYIIADLLGREQLSVLSKISALKLPVKSL